MLKALPEAKAMIADRGYDSDWFRAGRHLHRSRRRLLSQ
jgi:hypothetical protein